MSNIKFVTCEVTNKCNLNCKHCYLDDKNKKDLPTKYWLKIINLLSEQGIEHITISGGEPLMRKDLEKLVMRCKRNSIFCVITTNGILLDKNRLKKLKKAEIDFIQLSFEGTEKYHDYIRGKGSYKKVLAAIKLLKEKGVSFGTMTTLTAKNCLQIKNIIKSLIGLEVKKISFEKYLHTNKNAKNLSLNKKQTKDVYEYISSQKLKDIKIGINDPLRCLVEKTKHPYGGCFIGKYTCAIASNGDIKLCTKIPLVFGNIFRDKLEYLDRDKIVKKIIDRDFDNKWHCGGCRAEAFFQEGDILAKDNSCWK